jgi:hypothetical protein
MKRLLFPFLVLALGTCYAQFEKGNLLIGGSAEFSSTTNKSKVNGTTSTNSKTTSSSLSVNGGYFIINNLAVGAGLGISASSTKPDGGSGKVTSSGLSFEPYARYYFGPVFGQFQMGVGSGKYKSENGQGTINESKFSVLGWGLSVGYPIFLNADKSVALEPAVGYRSRTETLDATGNPKSINSTIFLRAGLQIYLSR